MGWMNTGRGDLRTQAIPSQVDPPEGVVHAEGPRDRRSSRARPARGPVCLFVLPPDSVVAEVQVPHRAVRAHRLRAKDGRYRLGKP